MSATAAQLQCTPAAESEDKRYEGVVASAVMRAMFPKDAARRAFLKSVGASTALAAISQFFPLGSRDRGVRPEARRDREEEPQGRLHPDHLRHADHHGAADGLLCEARPRRRSDQDRRLGGGPRQDHQQGIRRRPHAVADADRDHDGRRLESDPLHHAGGGEHQRPGDHAGDEAQGQARSEVSGRASSSPCRSTIRCTTTCCATTSPSTGIDPDQDIQIRSVPPPEMVANLRADNIDGFLAPDPVNQRAVYDGVGFIHILSKEIWDGHPCCAFAASKEFVTEIAQHLRGAAQGDHRRHRLRHQGGEPQADRRGDRAGQLPQPAGDGGGAGADRHLRRRARQRARRCPTASISIRSPGSRSRSGS